MYNKSEDNRHYNEDIMAKMIMHILLDQQIAQKEILDYDTAREFEVNYPLSKSADIKKKYL